MMFWSTCYFKTVSDHSGLKFPLNPTNLPGINNAQYHDVHHSPTGLNLNYEQPWFCVWDRIMGSYKDPQDGIHLPSRKED
jgi:sphinganine C4-monooxygenase